MDYRSINEDILNLILEITIARDLYEFEEDYLFHQLPYSKDDIAPILKFFQHCDILMVYDKQYCFKTQPIESRAIVELMWVGISNPLLDKLIMGKVNGSGT